ncbi:unnamed protein product [Sphagnum troendelagicum]|uniref:Uncharacterized protein n=1 Tax=Sphagnum troendelagicum TaxID=128251 RepID=A0ABP0TST3_9BRYO
MQEAAADWKAIVTWEVAAQECDIPIGEAGLEKAIPEAVTAVRKQIAALEVAVVVRIQELTVAFKGAVTQDASLEFWVLESPAASKTWEVTKQSLALLWNDYWSNVAQVALYAWHKESPEAFETWQKAWKEPRGAASEAWKEAREAASEAWQMAKTALHQAKMAHQNVVAAWNEARRVPVFSPDLANLHGADVSFWEKIMNDNWEAAERESSRQRHGPQFRTIAEIVEKATDKSLFLEKVLKSWRHINQQLQSEVTTSRPHSHYGLAPKKFFTVVLTEHVQNQCSVVESSLNLKQELRSEVAIPRQLYMLWICTEEVFDCPSD